MQLLGGKCFVQQLKPSLQQKNVKIVVPLQTVTAAMKLRHLFLGRKAMTNLDSILKGRDISLPTKVHIVKAVIFPLVMYGRDSWTMKKAECQRIDAFDRGVPEGS